MKKLVHCLALFIFSLLSGCSSYEKWDSTSWMQHIKDTMPIYKLSIPATHDSGAVLGGEFLQTQDSSIKEQLEKGIRGFDIRLQAINEDLGIYHATQFQHITWKKDVLPMFISFLNNHPSEMLIVSLKCEGGNRAEYSSLLSESLTNPILKDKFIWEFSPSLTLKDCRGKILFLHRDRIMENYPGVMCLNWGDNTTCDIILRGSNQKEVVASVEDEYQYASISEANYKSMTTIRNIQKSSEEPVDSHKWFISFASATALPKDGPKAFADKINPTIYEFLAKSPKNRGIIMIDFSASPSGEKIIQQVISSNFLH
ncbi:phosphatidylinositol-specific phospholipase C domain-containing protein [Phocaeicola faecicola]|uniref:phosphatidylinositol-specific phospholipase C domain-containing protein n=1 Tax=Phocaeicola faecicola TaxID=2739389 RepID=UPI0015E7BA40|nr:phosphatidylinositol-specific phospholipase C domain-containing protein [Phocaeicola faecicola]